MLTHNEAQNLPRCLDALRWCNDVVIIDSGSVDSTCSIAERYGARVISRPFDSFAAQRNFGLEAGRFAHDWVLHLDADEVVTPSFRIALDLLPECPAVDGYYVPSKLMIGEKWLKRSGNYPVFQARLGHKTRFRFIQVGHGQREHPDTRMAYFSEPYLHYNFSHGMRRWLEKHLQYAAAEAALLMSSEPTSVVPARRPFSRMGLRRAVKILAARLPYFLRPPLRFFHILVWNQGFRDGLAGLMYAVMLSVYEGMIAIFAYERLLEQFKVDAASVEPEVNCEGSGHLSDEERDA